MADANYSQLVTIKGLNKVWNDGVLKLYDKLDKRLDNIGQVYTFKKAFIKWTDNDAESADFVHYSGEDLYPIKKGDVISVNEGYPVYTKDPENYPQYKSGSPGRLFICIKASGNKPTYSDAGSEWEEYWTPIDLNLQVASESQYGVVQLGFPKSVDSSDMKLPLQIREDGKVYVDVSVGTKGTTSDTPGIIGALAVGEGLGLNENGEVTLKTASSDPGLYLSPEGVLSNTGVKSIGNLTGNLTVATADSSAGAIKFSVGDDNFEVAVSNWNDKQDVSTAVKHGGTPGTGTAKKGSKSLPIYVSSNGEADTITSIELGSISTAGDNVAHFMSSSSAGTDSKRTVYIQGYGTTSNADPGNTAQSTARVAFQVTGASRFVGAVSATKVYHAVWNDISDAIEVQNTLETLPGYCYYFDGIDYNRTTEYCQKGVIGIHSDTAGSVLGRKGKCRELDISVGGFVLAYVDKHYESGTPLTSAPDGKLTKMKLLSRIFHPERLVATYWKPEMKAEWGDDTHKVKVDGRHWVKVK